MFISNDKRIKFSGAASGTLTFDINNMTLGCRKCVEITATKLQN